MKIETEMEVLRADKMRLSEAKMEHDTSQVVLSMSSATSPHSH
jgi:hypothetical protein